jgi:hypothetical protein
MKKLEKNLFYLIIYSFLGFALETIVALVTKGVFESRKSFLYGPFCIIYGIGGIVLVNFLKDFKHQNLKLLLFGMILGSTVEYLGSFIGEKILGFVWWDYSNQAFNLNGRTSLFYSVCWGFISIVLINYLNPFIDYIFNLLMYKLSYQVLKFAIYGITIFLVFDIFATSIVLNNFYNRTITDYSIATPFSMDYLEKIPFLSNNSALANYINKNFSNDKLIKNYPNILIPTVSGSYISVSNLTGIEDSYYVKVF